LPRIDVVQHIIILHFFLQELGPRIAGAKSKAIMWLDRNLDLLQENGDPYEIAIVSYALLVAKATSAERAFSILASRARKEGKLTKLLST